MLLGGSESAEDEQEAEEGRNQNNGQRLKSGDRGMQVFVPQLVTENDGTKIVS